MCRILPVIGGSSISSAPSHVRAAEDGRAARRRGEPRAFSSYRDRYGEARGVLTPEAAWLLGYDTEDERLAVELSRPSHPAADLWHPVRRLGVQ